MTLTHAGPPTLPSGLATRGPLAAVVADRHAASAVRTQVDDLYALAQVVDGADPDFLDIADYAAGQLLAAGAALDIIERRRRRAGER